MNEGVVAFAWASGARRRAVKIAAAAVVVALAPVALPQSASAQGDLAVDSDGYVPVYDVCFAGSEVGYYSWYNDGYTTYGEISIDSCLLDSYGAGPADYDRVLAHEQGHAAGLGHSSDPADVMYPYTYIYQDETEQYEAPETEQYEAPETEQYEAPEEAGQPTPEDEQYTLDLAAEVQRYDPGQQIGGPAEAPVVREAPREERPPVRSDVGAEEKVAEERRKAEERKEAEDRKKEEERKKDEERDDAVERVRVEAGALARTVDGAGALTGEETRDRAGVLAQTLEGVEAGAKDGPLAEARTEAEALAESLTALRERSDEAAGDRTRALVETREKAEALAGALGRAGSEAQKETRAEDFEEASAEVRTVASELAGAEAEIEDREKERQDAGGRTTKDRSPEGQDTERGFFARIGELLARTFG